MAMIFLTAGILARRLPALLSRRRAASLPLLPIGGDTVPGSPVSSRGSPIFAPSHQLPATWAPLQSPPPAPPAHRPPCCPLPALPAPTCLSWRRPDLRSRATVRRTRRLRIIGRPHDVVSATTPLFSSEFFHPDIRDFYIFEREALDRVPQKAGLFARRFHQCRRKLRLHDLYRDAREPTTTAHIGQPARARQRSVEETTQRIEDVRQQDTIQIPGAYDVGPIISGEKAGILQQALAPIAVERQPPGCRLFLQQAKRIHGGVSRETYSGDRKVHGQTSVALRVAEERCGPAFHVKRGLYGYGVGETFTRRLSPLPSLSVETPGFSER